MVAAGVSVTAGVSLDVRGEPTGVEKGVVGGEDSWETVAGGPGEAVAGGLDETVAGGPGFGTETGENFLRN